jgi:DNA-binding winged helix-turn-helix (wHTH) protein/tetratricopeptide (TPR) repeat protein
MPHSPRFEFGPFQLDLNDRLLTRAGEVISLRPKATEILVKLVTNAGQLIKRDELLKEVWPDTFVEESNLSQTIFTLRKALGDDRTEPRYIETVPRRGYRFVGVVKDEEAKQHQALLATSTVPIARQQVVAVLPFLNQTGNPEIDYLADGITDTLINNLSRIPKVHVLSHRAVSAFKTTPIIPQQAGKELGATVVLFGKLSTRPTGIAIGVELVDASTGWQLWGETFDSESINPLDIQNPITQDLLRALKSTLTGDKESPVTARYTESGEAYEAYLEARRQCGTYTRSGIGKAILHFEKSIKLDPNYALAYTGIIDCYLRLVTDYIPTEYRISSCPSEIMYPALSPDYSDSNVKLRLDWDSKGAERELRRANELHTNYPNSHQWYAAYKTTQRLYEQTCLIGQKPNESTANRCELRDFMLSQFGSLELTPNEQVQVYCVISRDQIDAGNYNAACRLLNPWWSFGDWPNFEGLDQRRCADLLFTCGELAGCVASTLQKRQGQRHGEELLNGSIALFEQLGFRRRAAEGRIELALCYYRQGQFDMGRATLLRVLRELSAADSELRSLALIRLAILERHAGRLQDALAWLTEATTIMEKSGPWAVCRCHIELGSTYKDLAISEDAAHYFNAAKDYYLRALYEFAAVGNHRYVGIVENNLGFLLLTIGSYEEAETHLLRSRSLFEAFDDFVRAAQVNETLARLYIATEQFLSGQNAIELAIGTLELTDGEALLAEALTTSGLVNSKLGHQIEAKKNFEAAYRVAERCGDLEGAGRAVLVMIEEMDYFLDGVEKKQIFNHLKKLLAVTQQTGLRTRIEKALALIQA